MTGRPSAYTDDLAAEICERIAAGETLRQICRDDHMPDERTVRRWYIDDVGGFSPHYARARDIQLERMADEIAEIADDGSNDWMERENKDGSSDTVLNAEHVQRSRLRIESRKWLLSKLKPERYGDSLKLTGGLDLNHKTDDQLNARLAQLLGKTGSDRDPGGAGTAEEAP